jgi:hypothetical protein
MRIVNREAVYRILHCKSPGVLALLQWLFGLGGRAYSESAALLDHAVFRMTAAWMSEEDFTIIDRDAVL